MYTNSINRTIPYTIGKLWISFSFNSPFKRYVCRFRIKYWATVSMISWTIYEMKIVQSAQFVQTRNYIHT